MAYCPRCQSNLPDELTTCPTDGEALVRNEPVTKVGEYEIQGKVGEGGFGAVYRGVHPLIGKAVAIKVLHHRYSSDPEMVSRFVAEARAVNQVQSRNIVDIFAFGRLPDGRQYFVMELLNGSTLDEILRGRGRLPLEEAAPIVRGVARALAAAHAAGIVHRDLKPENIFVCTDEQGCAFPKLIDFGIAKLLDDPSGQGPHTRTGAPMGTPAYMSPEQARGRSVDHRTDIYALGVVIHVMLTGERPFRGGSAVDVLMKQVSEAPPRMSEVCPELPPELDKPVLQMMEKDADRRPQSVTAALAAFDAAVGDRAPAGRLSLMIDPGADPRATGAVPIKSVSPPGPSGTLTPAASEMSRIRGRRSPAIPLALAGVAAAIVVAVVAARGPSSAPAQSATAVASQPPTEAPRGAVTATAAPAPTAAAAAEVEIKADVSPVVADVYLGDTRLGTSKDPIKLKRGDEKVKLTFKAPGYAPQDVDVAPQPSSRVTVSLKKEQRPAGAKPNKPAGGDPSEIVF